MQNDLIQNQNLDLKNQIAKNVYARNLKENKFIR